MTVQFCPNCTAIDAPRRLEMDSVIVDYFKCDACGHIWTVDKKTGSLISHVTKPRNPVNG